MDKKYTCPKCGHQNEMSDDALKAVGHSIICPNCQSILKIEGNYAYMPLDDEEKKELIMTEDEKNETPPPFKAPQTHTTAPSIAQITGTQHDPIFAQAVEYVKTCNAISVPMLAHYFNVPTDRATHLMHELEKEGIVGPYNGGGPREILIEHNTNVPMGIKRTFAEDQETQALLDRLKEENGGEFPKIRTYGCNCSTLIIILFAILILSYIFAK